MIADEEIKLRGIKALVSELGDVQAERFITLILREPFDYTRGQERLWCNRSVADLSRAAMQMRSLEEPQRF